MKSRSGTSVKLMKWVLVGSLIAGFATGCGSGKEPDNKGSAGKSLSPSSPPTTQNKPGVDSKDSNPTDPSNSVGVIKLLSVDTNTASLTFSKSPELPKTPEVVAGPTKESDALFPPVVHYAAAGASLLAYWKADALMRFMEMSEYKAYNTLARTLNKAADKTAGSSVRKQLRDRLFGQETMRAEEATITAEINALQRQSREASALLRTEDQATTALQSQIDDIEKQIQYWKEYETKMAGRATNEIGAELRAKREEATRLEQERVQELRQAGSASDVAKRQLDEIRAVNRRVGELEIEQARLLENARQAEARIEALKKGNPATGTPGLEELQARLNPAQLNSHTRRLQTRAQEMIQDIEAKIAAVQAEAPAAAVQELEIALTAKRAERTALEAAHLESLAFEGNARKLATEIETQITELNEAIAALEKKFSGLIGQTKRAKTMAQKVTAGDAAKGVKSLAQIREELQAQASKFEGPLGDVAVAQGKIIERTERLLAVQRELRFLASDIQGLTLGAEKFSRGWIKEKILTGAPVNAMTSKGLRAVGRLRVLIFAYGALEVYNAMGGKFSFFGSNDEEKLEDL